MDRMQRRTAIRMGMMLPLWATSIPLFQQMAERLPYRIIPSSGERIPPVGLGSWITFDAGNDAGRKLQMAKVLKAFIDGGGTLIDTSPMYGSSEATIGNIARQQQTRDKLLIATKIWSDGVMAGSAQITNSNQHFKQRLRLLQIHNLRDFEIHYPYLQELQTSGEIQYIGVTHYLNSAHERVLEILRRHQLDFCQINYNIGNPHAEKRLLSEAQDLGVAVIVNRPFQTGRLFHQIKNMKLPTWVHEFGVYSWATYFLKYILSHPAVTCVIPATTNAIHVRKNILAGQGWLPNYHERMRMQKEFSGR